MSDNLRASLFMLLSMGGFAVNDALVKLATAEIEPAQVMAVRGTAASLLLLLIAGRRRALLPLGRALHPAIAWRTLADVGGTIAYVTALVHLPLSNTSAIFQALPLTVTAGAALFFGERVGRARWLAIAVGFVGVLVIVRPGTADFTIYSVAVLVCVLLSAVRDLMTRLMPPAIPSLFVAAVTSLAVTLFGWLLLPFVGWSPMSGWTCAAMFGAAFAVTAGYIGIVEAMRVGDVGFVAPFRYSVLVFAILLGVAVFDERPSALDLLGSAIIVGSGLFTIGRERRRGRVKATRTELH